MMQIDEPNTQPVVPVSVENSVVSRMLFIVVVSYASAMTLVCIVLLAIVWRDPSPLESLPDIKPPMKGNKIGLSFVDEGESMASGHTLKLNEAQRFGSFRVTPLRVCREPIEFVYYNASEQKTAPQTQPVLKLWLRFENVSEDQVAAPLDRTLMLKSIPAKDQPGLFRANNFVCRLDDKTKGQQKVLVYNNSPVIPNSDWDLKDQQAGKELRPGEVLETYVATTEEGVDALTGQLVWRLHFRKGYNRVSLRGVTTLIEVMFHSDEIVADS